MASTAWGIDVNEDSVKGVKLARSGAEVRVVAFDRVACAPPQTGEPAEREQRLRDALQSFLARNRVSGQVVVSMPEPAFNRVIPLPPVEAKRLDEIVQYEARQRIPFPLEEVTWAYQSLGHPGGSEETKVAIFAVQNQRIHSFCALLAQCKLDPDIVQIPSLALLNFVNFDCGTDKSVLVLNLGGARTDLVITDGESFWTREIRVSGASITKALQDKFQISYEDAEELKKQGAGSKQADKLLTVIRPILENLGAEVQRSISHFRTQINKNAEIESVLLAGTTSKLMGVKEVLKQSLGLEVTTLSQFNTMGVGAAAASPEFMEQMSAYCVAMGLGLQGLGAAEINISMLPRSMVVEKLIARKRPFAVAALAILALLVGFLYWANQHKQAELTATHQQAKKQYDDANELWNEYQKITNIDTLRAKFDLLGKQAVGSDLWVYIDNNVKQLVTKPGLKGQVWLSKIDSNVSVVTELDYEAEVRGEKVEYGRGTKAIKKQKQANRIGRLEVRLSGETPQPMKFVAETILPELQKVPGFDAVKTMVLYESVPAGDQTTGGAAEAAAGGPMEDAAPEAAAPAPDAEATGGTPAPTPEGRKKVVFEIWWLMRLGQPLGKAGSDTEGEKTS